MNTDHLTATMKLFVAKISDELKQISSSANAAQACVEAGDPEKGFEIAAGLDEGLYIVDRAITALWLMSRLLKSDSLR